MKEATKQDYIDIQGGMPKVKSEGGLTVIHHDYESGEGMIVRSHKDIRDYGEVTLQTKSGNTKRFKVALLRMFHGEPCEQNSLAAGGTGYDRARS